MAERDSDSDRKLQWAIGLGLFAVTVVTYASVVQHEFVNYDDLKLVVHNPKLTQAPTFSNLLVHVAMILMALVFACYGYGFAKFGFIQTSEMSGINMLSIYVSFPLAGASWALFLLEKIVEDVRSFSNQERGEAS